MKETKLTKICDYKIKRYYQDGDFFIDLEYHDTEHCRELGEVNVYIGDRSELDYGGVMELASFKCHTYCMEPERVLDIVENILGNALQQYDYYKHFLFQSNLERTKINENIDSAGPYYEEDYYDYYRYSGQWHRKIKRDIVIELKVERYKYGKYIFDIVKHDVLSTGFQVEIYVLGKKHSGKLLCDRFYVGTDDGTNNVCCKGYLQYSYARDRYICFYNDPSQIRISNPEFEKIYTKPYDDSDLSGGFMTMD